MGGDEEEGGTSWEHEHVSKGPVFSRIVPKANNREPVLRRLKRESTLKSYGYSKETRVLKTGSCPKSP